MQNVKMKSLQVEIYFNTLLLLFHKKNNFVTLMMVCHVHEQK